MTPPTADDLRNLGLTLMTIPGFVVHGCVITNNAEKIAQYITEHPALYRAGSQLFGEARQLAARAEHLLMIAGEVRDDEHAGSAVPGDHHARAEDGQ